MKILKFGGSSVATPERIRGVIDIIRASQKVGPVAVVVSAFGGVTDELIAIARQAASGDAQYKNRFEALRTRHEAAANVLVRRARVVITREWLDTVFKELKAVFRGVFLLREVSLRTMDLVMSFGERLSAYLVSQIISEHLPAEFLDAREVVQTENSFGGARVDFAATNQAISAYMSAHPALQIIAGFIGRTAKGETTTLGRGGSDYSAAVFGAALGADEIQIWTDVDGIMTADPRKVPTAFSIPEMTYQEALELSHFGAKVLHPPTVLPALHAHIPLCIRNTFHPEFPGTFIREEAAANHALIRGISSMRGMALLRIEGPGMVGVAGTAKRLFDALARFGINVILISQASSEHSICFAIREEDAARAKAEIEVEFKLELLAGHIDPVVVEIGLSIVAVVGEGMRRRPGVAGKLFGTLGQHGINVAAIAQGSSELNISVVINTDDEDRALVAIHDAFFAPRVSFRPIFLVGTGLIGGTLLHEIAKLKKSSLRVVGLADSKQMFFHKEGIDLAAWQQDLASSDEPRDLRVFVDRMKGLRLAGSVFVDCTASEELPNFYEEILRAGISIVTPNKKANSGAYERYEALGRAARESGVKFFYETTVGAALPVLSVLRDLLESGDHLLKIEAVLSGTLSYLFNNFSRGGRSFSEIVKEARARGYTEPDPREDLNGLDVARKILILAREAGLSLELSDVAIQNLVPEPCRGAKSVEDFLEMLRGHDGEFEKQRAQAAKDNKVLRYIAILEDGKAGAALQMVGSEHPFYSLTGSDNMIVFTTERYHEQPLVIRGPGAGQGVTAGGVLADILRISREEK